MTGDQNPGSVAPDLGGTNPAERTRRRALPPGWPLAEPHGCGRRYGRVPAPTALACAPDDQPRHFPPRWRRAPGDSTPRKPPPAVRRCTPSAMCRSNRAPWWPGSRPSPGHAQHRPRDVRPTCPRPRPEISPSASATTGVDSSSAAAHLGADPPAPQLRPAAGGERPGVNQRSGKRVPTIHRGAPWRGSPRPAPSHPAELPDLCAGAQQHRGTHPGGAFQQQLLNRPPQRPRPRRSARRPSGPRPPRPTAGVEHTLRRVRPMEKPGPGPPERWPRAGQIPAHDAEAPARQPGDLTPTNVGHVVPQRGSEPPANRGRRRRRAGPQRGGTRDVQGCSSPMYCTASSQGPRRSGPRWRPRYR